MITLPFALTLFTAHLVADFWLQSDHMALNKSKDWGALTWHVSVYTAVMLITVALYVLVMNVVVLEEMAWFTAATFAAHFVTDAITSRITTRLWFLRITPTGDTSKIWELGNDGNHVLRERPNAVVKDLGTRHWFFVVIGVDQWIHMVTLFATASWLGIA